MNSSDKCTFIATILTNTNLTVDFNVNDLNELAMACRKQLDGTPSYDQFLNATYDSIWHPDYLSEIEDLSDDESTKLSQLLTTIDEELIQQVRLLCD